MKGPKPPVFVFSEGSFASVGAALAHLESWYVEEYSPVLFDSMGNQLTASHNQLSIKVSVDQESGLQARIVQRPKV